MLTWRARAIYHIEGKANKCHEWRKLGKTLNRGIKNNVYYIIFVLILTTHGRDKPLYLYTLNQKICFPKEKLSHSNFRMTRWRIYLETFHLEQDQKRQSYVSKRHKHCHISLHYFYLAVWRWIRMAKGKLVKP